MVVKANNYSANAASASGGALYSQEVPTITLSENTASRNDAQYGGSFYVNGGYSLMASSNKFFLNEASFGKLVCAHFESSRCNF